jgi:hypothetical protein
VCAGTPVYYEQTVGEEDAASVYRYTGTLLGSRQDGVARPGRRMRQVCTGTPVHYEQAVMEGVGSPHRNAPSHGTVQGFRVQG